MTALRMRARDFLTEDQLVAVRQRVTWKGAALIAHAWALILGSIALVAWWPNPLTFLLAVGIIGSRQLGLAILMHDGAHGCLSADEKINLTLSQWFCAYPIFAETRAYRRYHLQHHARTQQDDDPDLILSAPFPITRMSYRRKFFRDITGQTGYQQRKAQLLNALGPKEWPLARARRAFLGKARPAICSQRGVVCWPHRRRHMVGLSAIVAVAAAHLADGHHPHSQHRRTRRRSRFERSLAQHPHHARELSRAVVHCTILRQLPSRASSVVLRALLQPAARAPHPL
ncbi:fatty acid desaturase [Bradyrhizobium sp. AZCC 1721]